MARVLTCLAAVLAVSVVSVGARMQQATGARRQTSSVPHAIVGRVTDAGGHPLAGVAVVALQRVTTRGHTRLSAVSMPISSTTNARGQFRLLSSYLGDHYLVAFPRNSPFAPADPAHRSGYTVTYYPNAASAAQARAVVVGAQATTTANIVMAASTLFGVSGVVIGSDKAPVHGGGLRLAHGDGLFGLDSGAVPIKPDGTFVTYGLPPGTYFLQFREGLWPPPANAIPKVSGTKVTIVDADLTNVRVTPIAMVRVTGRIVVDPAARKGLPVSTIEVGASPADFEGNPGPQRPGLVRQDLSFEFWTWPDDAYIRVLMLSPGWRVKAARLKGVDITDKDVDLRHDLSGLEIELVPRQ